MKYKQWLLPGALLTSYKWTKTGKSYQQYKLLPVVLFMSFLSSFEISARFILYKKVRKSRWNVVETEKRHEQQQVTIGICMMASFYYYDQNPSGFSFLILVQIIAFVI